MRRILMLPAMLVCLATQTMSAAVAHATADIPISKDDRADDVPKSNLPSYPVGAAEPVMRTAKVAFLSDGFSLEPKYCLLVETSGDATADLQACKTVQFYKTDVGKPGIEEAPVWSVQPVEGHFVGPTIINSDKAVLGYPVGSLRKGAQGTVTVKLLVEVSGKVSECAVMVTSGDSALDRVTCSALSKKAKFRPATLDNQPVAAYHFTGATFYQGNGPRKAR